MRRRTWGVAAALLALTGYVALDAVDVVPGYLTSDVSVAPMAERAGDEMDAGAGPDTTAGTDDADASTAQNAAGGGASPLPGLRPDAPMPTRVALAAALTPLLQAPALGTSVGMEVRDARTGETLFAAGNRKPQTPASLTKIVTAAAVTSVITDPRADYITRVVRGRAPTDLVLVAGGDNLLSAGAGRPGAVVGHAGLGDLADRVVASLGPSRGSRSAPLRLVLDDSYARGQALAPGWLPDDVAAGITGPVAMLGLGTDRAVPGKPASVDPALTAADALAAQLSARGVRLAPNVARGPAPSEAVELGRVRSAPVLDVLALALDESDNDLTETVARAACVEAGVAPTFPACAAWVRSRLGGLDIDASRVRLVDTSGLSAGTLIPAAVVTDLLVRASNSSDPALARVLARLPVAGLSGTLHDRFRAPSALGGRGVVRAKTGTLTGVSSLAGTVVDAAGRQLVFTIMADRVPATGTLAARASLDALATALAGCGCRG